MTQGLTRPIVRSYGGASSRDMATASGTQVITGVGFKPRAIMFNSAEDDVAGVASWGWYASDGINNVCLRESYLTVAGAYVVNPGGCIHVQKNAGNSDQYAASVTTVGDDGFTLTWTRTGTPTGTLKFIFNCLR